jgi:hypothetical protein
MPMMVGCPLSSSLPRHGCNLLIWFHKPPLNTAQKAHLPAKEWITYVKHKAGWGAQNPAIYGSWGLLARNLRHH